MKRSGGIAAIAFMILALNGPALAQESGWREEGYVLKPLNEVEIFIQTHKHLPDVPSAEEVAADGLSLGETQTLLLQKIEELTLYVIDLKKENEALKTRFEQLAK